MPLSTSGVRLPSVALLALRLARVGVDLTKEQRDAHIRRYAELLERADQEDAENQSRQNVAIESKRDDGRGHRPKGIASKVADETGLNVRTVQRVLNPTPPKPKEVMSDEDDDIWVSSMPVHPARARARAAT